MNGPSPQSLQSGSDPGWRKTVRRPLPKISKVLQDPLFQLFRRLLAHRMPLLLTSVHAAYIRMCCRTDVACMWLSCHNFGRQKHSLSTVVCEQA